MKAKVWVLTRYEDVISVHQTLGGAEIAQKKALKKWPSAGYHIKEAKLKE